MSSKRPRLWYLYTFNGHIISFGVGFAYYSVRAVQSLITIIGKSSHALFFFAFFWEFVSINLNQMKKNKLFGLALLVSMASFTACSNDTEDLLIQENEIKLTSEIVPTTRVASLEYQSTQIVKGQLVGVTIIGAKGEHNNVAWEAGTNGALTNTGENIYYSGNAEAKITAYHPYNTAWKGTSHTFSINTDQSTNEGYLASDLLWASKTVTKTEEAVALTFTHKLAKINITLVPENDTEEDKAKLNNAIISICNTKTSTTIDLSNGNIPENAIGNVQEIKAGVGSTASAIVIPQTITGNTKFIKIEHSGKTFYYTLGDTGKKIKSGYSHNYTLTVKEQTVEIKTESDEITDWKDDDNIGDAEEEVSTIPNNEIWYTTTNGEVIDISNSSTFNTDIESNTYNNGKGVIKFNSDVTTINKGEFSVSATLASVVLPKSVTKIGQEAFSGSESLERITISNSVKEIEARAFTGCASLTSITIPNSVNTIGDQAFFGCI